MEYKEIQGNRIQLNFIEHNGSGEKVFLVETDVDAMDRLL